MLRTARAIIADVVEVYRAMSDKPVKDLLQSLHNPRQLTIAGAPEIASTIFVELMAKSPARPSQPQPRPA